MCNGLGSHDISLKHISKDLTDFSSITKKADTEGDKKSLSVLDARGCYAVCFLRHYSFITSLYDILYVSFKQDTHIIVMRWRNGRKDIDTENHISPLLIEDPC